MNNKVLDKAESSVERVAADLRGAIAAGIYIPGQAIPSQRELAEQWQVSRATVREAVLMLELEGLIQTQHGGRSRCVNLMEPYLNLPMESSGGSREFQLQVLEARATLEAEAAFYAATRATDEQLQALTGEYARMMERNAGESTLAKAKADLMFHMMIAEASHHLLIISFSQLFYNRYFNAIYGVLSQTLKRYGRYPEGIAQQHARIHRAIQQRQPEVAREAARTHILYTRQLLERIEVCP